MDWIALTGLIVVFIILAVGIKCTFFPTEYDTVAEEDSYDEYLRKEFGEDWYEKL